MKHWWRRLTGRNNPPATNLIFKSSEAFFNFYCEFGTTTIVEGRAIPALVLDATQFSGAKNAIKINKDGSQFALIKVTSPEGGWITVADTPNNRHTPIEPGDLVAWMPLELGPHLLTTDTRSRWLGLIIAKLAPEMDTNGGKVVELF